jgi:AsmA protein
MRTFFRLLGVLLLLLILGAVALALYVDPNDFKPQIARQVEQRLGRPVQIEGDIDLSVFPWLGLEVGRVKIGNPAGFADPHFAGVERLDIRAKLLPLLRSELEMDTLTVHGLDLRLVRNRAGRTNWEDLGGRGRATPGPGPDATPAPPRAPGLASVAVGGLDVRDGRVTWTDEPAGRRYAVEALTVHSGVIAPGRSVPVEVSGRVRAGEPATTTDVTLKAQVDASTERQEYRLREVELAARARGKGLPAESLDAKLRGQITVNLAEQRLSASPLTLEALGVRADLAVAVEQLAVNPTFNVAVDVRETSLRTLVERLGGAPPRTADPQALARASLSTRVAGTAAAFTLEPLLLRLDQSTVEGRLEVAGLAGPTVRFDLAVDQLDLDRYLPPPAPGERPTPPPTPAAAGGAAAALPVETLRRLDASGTLRVGELKAGGLRASALTLTFTAKEGVLRLDPIEAQVYQGSYAGRSTLDVRGAAPKLALNDRLSGVQAEPLLTDLLGKARIRGRADAVLSLQMTATDADSALRTLSGDGRFSFNDGAVKGVNIGRLVREARALIEGRRLAPEEGEVETDFSELRGTVQIANGVARNDDLYGKSPLLRVEGKGSTDLVRSKVDYLLTAILVNTSRGQGGKELEDLEGLPIPVQVSGSLENPSYKVRLDAVVKDRAREEARKKAEEAVDKKLGGEQGEAVKELLRGLFR